MCIFLAAQTFSAWTYNNAHRTPIIFLNFTVKARRKLSATGDRSSKEVGSSDRMFFRPLHFSFFFSQTSANSCSDEMAQQHPGLGGHAQHTILSTCKSSMLEAVQVQPHVTVILISRGMVINAELARHSPKAKKFDAYSSSYLKTLAFFISRKFWEKSASSFEPSWPAVNQWSEELLVSLSTTDRHV